MNIAVCIKQVPDTAEIRIDPIKNTLIRAGVPSIMNPCDRNAVEAALRLKDECGATVTVVTMGPAQASAILREALAMGADRVFLITDRKFGGSDTYATSYILASVMRHLGPFDLVLGGSQAIDGDTGQTISSLAAHLDWPILTQLCELEVNGTKVRAARSVEEGTEWVRTELPVVCSATKELNKPRYATLAGKIESLTAEIPEVHFDDIAETIDPTRIGLKGSPTRVKSTFVPPRESEGKRIEGTPGVMARSLIDELLEAKVL